MHLLTVRLGTRRPTPLVVMPSSIRKHIARVSPPSVEGHQSKDDGQLAGEAERLGKGMVVSGHTVLKSLWHQRGHPRGVPSSHVRKAPGLIRGPAYPIVVHKVQEAPAVGVGEMFLAALASAPDEGPERGVARHHDDGHKRRACKDRVFPVQRRPAVVHGYVVVDFQHPLRVHGDVLVVLGVPAGDASRAATAAAQVFARPFEFGSWRDDAVVVPEHGSGELVVVGVGFARRGVVEPLVVALLVIVEFELVYYEEERGRVAAAAPAGLGAEQARRAFVCAAALGGTLVLGLIGGQPCGRGLDGEGVATHWRAKSHGGCGDDGGVREGLLMMDVLSRGSDGPSCAFVGLY